MRNDFLEGWKIILNGVWRLLKSLLEPFAELLPRLSSDKRRTTGRRFREVCCLELPPQIRARPDPYIYSQEWLNLRGLAFVWDNPDFRIIDTATGRLTTPFEVKADTDYDVEVKIHNNSFMAAIGALVHFEVHAFGAGTLLMADLGAVNLDVPGAGTSIARIHWHTPVTGGHHCLRATISHPDDANPLNNVGQHNVSIAVPASPTRRVIFLVRNNATNARAVFLTMDSYKLPDLAMCAKTYKERQSLEYLRRLQAANDVRKFPVPDYLHARLSKEKLELGSEEEVEVSLEVFPPPAGMVAF